MKLNYKILLLFFSFLFIQAYAIKSNHGMDGYVEYKIDVSKNARAHSNMGNIHFQEKKYIAALREYEIAYNLTANTTGSATYLYNIARCYIAVGNYKLAKKALLGAIDKDCMNMTYYDALCDCYIKLGNDKKEIENYLQKPQNPYNRIVVGLLYLKTGHKTTPKLIFDDFINENPDMLITNDIKAILRNL